MKKKEIWLVLASIFGISYGALWTILEVSSYFGFNYFKDIGFIGHIIFVSISLNITVFIGLWRGLIASPKHFPFIKPYYSGEELSKALVEQFKEMLDLQDYQTILRIGLPLSRALWLEGLYKTRITIGHIVEEAAAQLENIEAQTRAFIDDIGWTSVALGELDNAEKYLNRGIYLSNTNGLKYYESKGYRHLAGIAIQRNRNRDALSLLVHALNAASEIENEREKKEMIAGILYGKAEAYLHLDQLKDAENTNKEAYKLFLENNDNLRIVKILSQLGKIRELQGKTLDAQDCYRQGLKLAEEVDRRDEIIRNHLGLARVALTQKNKRGAKKHLTIAKEMQKITPLVFEIDSIEDQIQEIERRQDNGT